MDGITTLSAHIGDNNKANSLQVSIYQDVLRLSSGLAQWHGRHLAHSLPDKEHAKYSCGLSSDDVRYVRWPSPSATLTRRDRTGRDPG